MSFLPLIISVIVAAITVTATLTGYYIIQRYREKEKDKKGKKDQTYRDYLRIVYIPNPALPVDILLDKPTNFFCRFTSEDNHTSAKGNLFRLFWMRVKQGT